MKITKSGTTKIEIAAGRILDELSVTHAPIWGSLTPHQYYGLLTVIKKLLYAKNQQTLNLLRTKDGYTILKMLLAQHEGASDE